ncbi:MAG TPA: hypothetical protein VFI25_11020 [Planctomycetota bacterium]|jgi:hypothetical protein|nr:hypothetical protein [Planctomycetota bacterium]
MRLKSSRGNVLIVLVASVFLIAGSLASLLTLETARSRRVAEERNLDRAFLLAESGVDAVHALLNARAWNPVAGLDWSTDGLDNDGDGLVDEGDETVAATTEDWSTDGLDNDGDGTTDEADEQVVRVFSAASVGPSGRRVEAFLKRNEVDIPTPGAAIYLNDPNAQVQFSGNSFGVSGNDVTLAGLAGPAPAVYGIGVNITPKTVVSQLKKGQLNNIVGIGGIGSVGLQLEPEPNFIESVVQTFASRADITFPAGYSGTYTGSLGSLPTAPTWSNGDYKVTYAAGDLKISGGSHGAGLLLVDGNLEITGNWEYVGYVFVTGSVIFKGGGNSNPARLRGSLFVGEDVLGGDLATKLAGKIEVDYSSQALSLVRTTLTNYAVLAFTEPAQPKEAIGLGALCPAGGGVSLPSPTDLLPNLP